MIKAGKLDRYITLEREIEQVAASGAVSKFWAGFAHVRAERLQASTEEYLAGFGEADAGGAVFRIRYLPGIITGNRVVCDGVAYDINEIAEMGRKRGLELRCVRIPA